MCVLAMRVYVHVCMHISPPHPSIIGVGQEGRANRAAGGGGRRGVRCLGGGSSRGDGGCRVRTLCVYVCVCGVYMCVITHKHIHARVPPSSLTHMRVCTPSSIQTNQQAERPPLLSQPGRGARGGLRARFAVRTFVHV